MNEGYIKLYRKLLDSEMYQALESKHRDVMMQCLLLANHAPRRVQFGAEIITIQPGQFITSLESLGEKCAKDVNVQSVRTALLKLEKWDFLTNLSTKHGRLVSICNWESYQLEKTTANKPSNKQLTNVQQTANKQLTINNNEKNDKNEKKIISLEKGASDSATKRASFTAPTLETLIEFFKEKKLIEWGSEKCEIEATKFWYHYDSKNWMVGKSKMQRWASAVAGWINRAEEFEKKPAYSKVARLSNLTVSKDFSEKM